MYGMKFARAWLGQTTYTSQYDTLVVCIGTPVVCFTIASSPPKLYSMLENEAILFGGPRGGHHYRIIKSMGVGEMHQFNLTAIPASLFQPIVLVYFLFSVLVLYSNIVINISIK